MSRPIRGSEADRCELPPGTCWPLVFGAAGFVGLIIVAAVLIMPDSPASKPKEAHRRVVISEPALPTPTYLAQDRVATHEGGITLPPRYEAEPQPTGFARLTPKADRRTGERSSPSEEEPALLAHLLK